MDGREHWERTRFDMDSSCHSISILSDLILHRRRYHVDLPHGGYLESQLRHFQQAMAAETEKKKKLLPTYSLLRLSSHALLRRNRELLILQRGYYG